MISCSVHVFVIGVECDSVLGLELEFGSDIECGVENGFNDDEEELGIRERRCGSRGGGVPSGTCTGISH